MASKQAKPRATFLSLDDSRPPRSDSGVTSVFLPGKERYRFRAGKVYHIGLGFKLTVPRGFKALVTNDPKLARVGLTVLPSVVYHGQEGEVFISVAPLEGDVFLEPGDKIAEIIFLKNETAELKEQE